MAVIGFPVYLSSKPCSLVWGQLGESGLERVAVNQELPQTSGQPLELLQTPYSVLGPKLIL